jgi:tetratricopeptide (TPR) repeat protein
MDRGENLMEAGRYEEANDAFMFVLDNKEVLPVDMAYLFGRNSFHLGKYKQSINWLNKYIQLRGSKARYFDDAVKYLELSEKGYREKQQNRLANKDDQDEELENLETLASAEFDCGGLDKMICPVCRGSGVLITSGSFEKQYQTCPLSKGEGYISCEEYNRFMRGELSSFGN